MATIILANTSRLTAPLAKMGILNRAVPVRILFHIVKLLVNSY